MAHDPVIILQLHGVLYYFFACCTVCTRHWQHLQCIHSALMREDVGLWSCLPR